MDLGLTGKRALVGGASSGLGAAIAAELAGEGARVSVVARSGDRLRASAERIGGVAVDVDLATASGPGSAVERTVGALGGLDLVVVNSGGPPGGTFEQVTDETWARAAEGTLLSTVRLIRAALPHLRQGIDPAILVIVSSSVRQPIPGLVTSNVLRPGLAGLVKTLVDEIAPVRINAIAPGKISTDRVGAIDAARAEREGITPEAVHERNESRIPLGRYGAPPEVGRVGAFLLSPASSYVNGVILSVDGGMNRALP